MAGKYARDILFEYLELEGIPFIFGNPGTTEMPLVDGVNDHPSIRYVLSLHEDVAVAQAMGYARGSGKVGVVSLHVTPGVAHGLGNLYNAFRARVPLLILAGQHHTGLQVHEPILTADLAALVRPFTKWSYEVRLREELPVALQRAFKELHTPPYGPVLLSMPPELLLQERGDCPPAAISSIAPAVPDRTWIARAATALAGARSPLILAGDGVGHARAWRDVAMIAEAIGAPVHTESYSTLWNFPVEHPLWAGSLSNQAGPMRKRFDGVDVALVCGFTSQAPVSRYDGGGPLIPAHVRVISVDDSPWEMGKNGPVTIGLLGDVRQTLAALAAATRALPGVAGTVERRAAVEAANAQRAAQWTETVSAARKAAAITPALVSATLRDLLPADAIFVDETISNRESFVNVLRFGDPLAYYNANGLSLGFSAGVAVGLKMALPERTVVNVVGDGSLLYYPQALWNAAVEKRPLLFVVLNNGTYRVLKQIVDRMGGPWSASRAAPPGLDFEPPVDFTAMARSFGVDAVRASSPAKLRPALERGLAATGPFLVEVALAQGGTG